MMRIQQINWNLDSVSWKTQHPTPDIADLSIPKCQVHLLRIYLLQQTWDSFSFHLWTIQMVPSRKNGYHTFFSFLELYKLFKVNFLWPFTMFFPSFCPNWDARLPSPPGGRSITTHDLKFVFLSAVTVLQTENNTWKIMYPKDPITLSDDEQGVYNHLLRKVFRFHYHSQKVIGSLGVVECGMLWLTKNMSEKGGLGMEPWTPAPRQYIADLWLVS